MHPEFGMGVEFASKTKDHRRLMEDCDPSTDSKSRPFTWVLVEPEGLDWGDRGEELPEDSSVSTAWEPEELEDPLLGLLRTGAPLPSLDYSARL